MKKFLLIAATTMIAFGGTTGCKKDSSTSPSYSMKATVGSSSFNTSHCIASAANGGLIITGWTGSSTTATAPMMVIAITSWNQGTGTVNFDASMSNGYEEYVASTTTTSLAQTGTVNITSVASNAISGTFSFTATDGTVVSGGTFTAQK